MAYEVEVGVRWVRASVRRRDGKGRVERFVRCAWVRYGEVMSHGNEGSIVCFDALMSWSWLVSRWMDDVFSIETSGESVILNDTSCCWKGVTCTAAESGLIRICS